MRSEPTIRVTCDREPDCIEAIEIPLEVELAQQDAFVAERLEQSGWQVGEDGQDVCPKCATAEALAGRVPVQQVRLTLRMDRELVAKVRGLAGVYGSLSEALRVGLGGALDAIDRGGTLPETEQGDWQIVALKLSPELNERIAGALASGKAPSIVALVRGAAEMLVNRADVTAEAPQGQG